MDDMAHFLQDAAECYWALIVQKGFEERGLAHLGSIEEKETEFCDYCSERKIEEKFDGSDYKVNMDHALIGFIDGLVEAFPGKKMDITNVEAEYRNMSMKGDFIITFDGETEEISFSLKNYRGGYDSIQLCSGTWHSMINNNALSKAPGPGMYYDVETGLKFKAQKKSLKQRDENYQKLGLGEVIPILHEIDLIQEELRGKYITPEEMRIFDDRVKSEWKKDCSELGNKGIELVIRAFDKIPKEKIHKNFMQQTDLCHKEELLLIGPNGDMMCSLFNEPYKKLLSRANDDSCVLSYFKYAKNLRMKLSDSEGDILHIDVPFTLQKNGSWYIPKDRYEGEIFHMKEQKHLVYGERRPKKSKEISTSTNMWFRIKTHL